MSRPTLHTHHIHQGTIITTNTHPPSLPPYCRSYCYELHPASEVKTVGNQLTIRTREELVQAEGVNHGDPEDYLKGEERHTDVGLFKPHPLLSSSPPSKHAPARPLTVPVLTHAHVQTHARTHTHLSHPVNSHICPNSYLPTRHLNTNYMYKLSQTPSHTHTLAYRYIVPDTKKSSAPLQQTIHYTIPCEIFYINIFPSSENMIAVAGMRARCAEIISLRACTVPVCKVPVQAVMES